MIFPKTKTTRGKVSNLNKIEGDSGDFRRRRCGVSVFAYDCVGISLSFTVEEENLKFHFEYVSRQRSARGWKCIFGGNFKFLPLAGR